MSLLELNGVNVHYGRIQATAPSFTVNEGEVVSLGWRQRRRQDNHPEDHLGAFSTRAGQITFDGDDITKTRRTCAWSRAYREQWRVVASFRA